MSKYFKTPKAWRKALTTKFHEDMELGAQAEFHRKAINKVKKAIGSDCTFLAHIVDGKSNSFLAIIKKGDLKQRVVIETTVEKASDFKADHYKNLNDALNEFRRS